MGMGDITDTSPDTTNEATMAQSLKEWQHAVDSIGWGNLILVWLALMVAGVVVALPYKGKEKSA